MNHDHNPGDQKPVNFQCQPVTSKGAMFCLIPAVIGRGLILMYQSENDTKKEAG
jgi:hypothetical protein